MSHQTLLPRQWKPTHLCCVCSLLTSSENINTTCMGCIGAKGEKFCAKPKVGQGELDTCGVQAHSKKTITVERSIYFVDSIKSQCYITPKLHTGFDLADAIWDMRTEDLTRRIQFQELISLVEA
jgi:hypothetical protein